ncbi:hypothetical protein [Actinomadura chokoriensis]|uniref:hypothetical protein n=1 Tax=Actinomadura chokoriensis TaxID=454156 RepID=UPI0031F9EE80
MAGGAAQIRMVPVRLRRVVAERAVQRLLVLGGLLIAGWLLGCAAQAAHADELPPPPSAASVVAETPVLGQAVTAVHEREPVRRVVRAVVAKAPRAVTQEPSALPARDMPAIPVSGRLDAASKVAQPAPASHVHPAPQGGRGTPTALHVSRTRPSIGHATSHDVRHPAVPAPQQHGDHSAGGAAIGGLTAGFPNTGSWAPAPPRASVARVVGAIPPAVRTAADEPSFAPD